VFQTCRKTGMLRFEYNDPWSLWFELVPEYQSRVDAIVRRADSLSLGDYTLGHFKQESKRLGDELDASSW